MKNQKGITLVSLTIYIIVVIIVVGILATVRNSFQSGVKEMSQSASAEAEFNKFNLYFLEDIKKPGNKPTIENENEDSPKTIEFSLTKNKYTYIGNTESDKDKNSIYFNNIKLLSDVKSATFKKEEKEEAGEKNGKTVIVVTVTFNYSTQETITKTYTLAEDEAGNNYEYEEDYVYRKNTTNEITNEVLNQTQNQITNEVTNETANQV